MSLKELYENKLNLLKEIKQVTIKMKETLESVDVENFSVLVNDRQNIMNKIDSIDELICPEMDVKADKPAITSLKNDISDILNSIREADNIIHKKAVECKQGISQRIKHLSKSKVALNNYDRKPSQFKGYFVEKKK